MMQNERHILYTVRRSGLQWSAAALLGALGLVACGTPASDTASAPPVTTSPVLIATAVIPPPTGASAIGGTRTIDTGSTRVPSEVPTMTTGDSPATQLEPLLLQPGDLPTEVSSQRAAEPGPVNFENTPPAALIIGLRFARTSRPGGGMFLLLYDNPVALAQAYERLTASVRDEGTASGGPLQPVPDVGERAVSTQISLRSSTSGTAHVAVLIFARCHALISIQLDDRAGLTGEHAVAYARRLDQRLRRVVCSASPSADVTSTAMSTSKP